MKDLLARAESDERERETEKQKQTDRDRETEGECLKFYLFPVICPATDGASTGIARTSATRNSTSGGQPTTPHSSRGVETHAGQLPCYSVIRRP